MTACVHGPSCSGPDRHGWDCPASDPMGDVLTGLAGPLDNPILEGARADLARRWFPVPDSPASLDPEGNDR